DSAFPGTRATTLRPLGAQLNTQGGWFLVVPPMADSRSARHERADRPQSRAGPHSGCYGKLSTRGYIASSAYFGRYAEINPQLPSDQPHVVGSPYPAVHGPGR